MKQYFSFSQVLSNKVISFWNILFCVCVFEFWVLSLYTLFVSLFLSLLKTTFRFKNKKYNQTRIFLQFITSHHLYSRNTLWCTTLFRKNAFFFCLKTCIKRRCKKQNIAPRKKKSYLSFSLYILKSVQYKEMERYRKWGISWWNSNSVLFCSNLLHIYFIYLFHYFTVFDHFMLFNVIFWFTHDGWYVWLYYKVYIRKKLYGRLF